MSHLIVGCCQVGHPELYFISNNIQHFCERFYIYTLYLKEQFSFKRNKILADQLKAEEGEDLESKDKWTQAVHVVTEEVKRDNMEGLGQSYKLLKSWKTQNEEPERDIFCKRMLVKVWEKAKSDQNSRQRVTLLVAFLMDWKMYQAVQL